MRGACAVALTFTIGLGCQGRIQEQLPASRAQLSAAVEPRVAEPVPAVAPPVPVPVREPVAVFAADGVEAAQLNPNDAGPRVMDAKLAMPQPHYGCQYGFRPDDADGCMPSLLRLDLQAVVLDPPFSGRITQYTASVPLTTSNVSLLLNGRDQAELSLNEQPLVQGRWHEQPLEPGPNKLRIEVAEPGFPSSEYVIDITRGVPR